MLAREGGAPFRELYNSSCYKRGGDVMQKNNNYPIARSTVRPSCDETVDNDRLSDVSVVGRPLYCASMLVEVSTSQVDPGMALAAAMGAPGFLFVACRGDGT